MVTDYEAAWADLAEAVQESPGGWGVRNLLAEMSRIAARHRVTETQVEQVLRLYGGRVAIVMSTPAEGANGSGGTSPDGAAPSARATEDRGGRDGSSISREPVQA